MQGRAAGREKGIPETVLSEAEVLGTVFFLMAGTLNTAGG